MEKTIQDREEEKKLDALVKLVKKREKQIQKKEEKEMKKSDSQATLAKSDSQATLVKSQSISDTSEIWDNSRMIPLPFNDSTLESVLEELEFRRNLGRR